MWRPGIGLLLLTAQTPAQVAVWSFEGRVRRVIYDGLYDLAGIALLAGLSKRFYWNNDRFVVGDGALNLAYAKAQADGDPKLTVTLPQAAVHALLGVGRDF